MAKFAINLKNTKQVAIIAAVVGIAALYSYINYLLLPQIQNVAKSYGKLSRIRAEVKIAQRAVSEIEGLKKQVAKYQGKIESYERMLPAEQEIPKLLGDLSEMAKTSGVKIVGITPFQPKQEAQSVERIYQEKPILINAKSGYHELGKFLADLENADRFMEVVDINIKVNNATPKRHDVELLVLTYVLPRNK